MRTISPEFRAWWLDLVHRQFRGYFQGAFHHFRRLWVDLSPIPGIPALEDVEALMDQRWLGPLVIGERRLRAIATEHKPLANFRPNPKLAWFVAGAVLHLHDYAAVAKCAELDPREDWPAVLAHMFAHEKLLDLPLALPAPRESEVRA